MHTRFLHSSDWQLGVTRHFLDGESQARWSAARFDAIRNLGRIATAESCEFIVVAGDIFESNQINRKTVSKTCEVMSEIEMPIYLLPGNHDSLDAGSVFRSKHWKERKPANVIVLDEFGFIHQVRPGIEVVGAPWASKRPLSDLITDVAVSLTTGSGSLRILVGHGAVDVLSPTADNPSAIRLADAEKAIFEGRFQYLAIGDRHSFTKVGSTGRIFYSGTHEAYDFDEMDPGKVLIVDLEEKEATVTPKQNGLWRFIVHETHISSLEDIEALSRHLESLQDKERTILKLGLIGTLSMQLYVHLEAVEEHARDLFAAVIRSTSRSELVIVPDNSDFDDLSLAGFAASTVEKLRVQAQESGPQAEQATDALALLMRLARRVA